MTKTFLFDFPCFCVLTDQVSFQLDVNDPNILVLTLLLLKVLNFYAFHFIWYEGKYIAVIMALLKEISAVNVMAERDQWKIV